MMSGFADDVKEFTNVLLGIVPPVDEGLAYINQVKSTRAIIDLARTELAMLPFEDKIIIRGPLDCAVDQFKYAAENGHDFTSAVGEIHKWYVTIDNLRAAQLQDAGE